MNSIKMKKMITLLLTVTMLAACLTDGYIMPASAAKLPSLPPTWVKNNMEGDLVAENNVVYDPINIKFTLNQDAKSQGALFSGRLLQGNGEIHSRIFSDKNTPGSLRGGVIMAAGQEMSGAFAALCRSEDAGLELIYRSEEGSAIQTLALGEAALPKYLRILRKGGNLAASCSADGKDWRVVKTLLISLPEDYYAGLLITSDQYPGSVAVLSAEKAAKQAAGKYIFNDVYCGNGKKAVILLPGITGSELFSIDGDRCWLPENTDDILSLLQEKTSSGAGKITEDEILNDPGIARFQNQIRKLACNQNGDMIDPLVAKDPDPSDAAYGTENYYGTMMYALKAAMAPSGYDVLFYPYNWTQGVDKTACDLNSYVLSRGYSDVVLVAHSMGGLVAAKYIQMSSGNREKVEKVITMGTPFLGAPKALYILETGRIMESPDDAGSLEVEAVVRLTAAPFKEIVGNMESAYDLLPGSQYMKMNNTTYIKRIDAALEKDSGKLVKPYLSNVTVSAIGTHDFLSNRLFNKTLWEKSVQVNDSLYTNGKYIMNTVNAYFIVGTGKKTVSQVNEIFVDMSADKSLDQKRSEYYTSTTETTMEGDGTVPVSSATIGYTTASDRTFYVEESHGQLPSNPEVILKVVQLLGE